MDSELRSISRGGDPVATLWANARGGQAIGLSLLELAEECDLQGASEWLSWRVSDLAAREERVLLAQALGCRSAGGLLGQRNVSPGLSGFASSIERNYSALRAFAEAFVRVAVASEAAAWLAGEQIRRSRDPALDDYFRQPVVAGLARQAEEFIRLGEPIRATQLALAAVRHMGKTVFQTHGLVNEVDDGMESVLYVLDRCRLARPFCLPREASRAAICGALGLVSGRPCAEVPSPEELLSALRAPRLWLNGQDEHP